MPSQITTPKDCLHLLPGASKTNSRPHGANSHPSTQAEACQHENLEQFWMSWLKYLMYSLRTLLNAINLNGLS